MRIGIDARFYGPLSTGLGRYTAELVENLLPLDPSLELTLFVRQDGWSTVPDHPRVRRVLFPHRWYTVAEQLRFPSAIRRSRVELMHFPHFNVPLAAPRPFVVTIHDLILHDFPTERATTLGPLQYWLKRQAYHLVIRRAVERAERILTISKTSADNLVRHFGIQRERIAVTYEGASTLQSGGSAEDDRAALARFGLKPGFTFYVGNAYPHKNLEALLKAWLRVRAQRPEAVLVIAGKVDYFSKRLQALADELGLTAERAVVFTGFLTDRELVACYRSAALYVFPSMAEGFGLPALEAMAFGLPVAASSASCLPEVLGDAARYFDPRRPDDLARVVIELLNDESASNTLRVRGFARVKQFSWRQLASDTLAVYRSVVGDRHGYS